MYLTVACYVDTSSESDDDTDNNFYSMSEVRRRNADHQWQDRIQRQSRLCVTLSISKGRVLACTASQVSIAFCARQHYMLQRVYVIAILDGRLDVWTDVRHTGGLYKNG